MADSTTPPGSPGSLSQTKLADLPGFVPGDVQAIELQVGQVLSGRYEIQALIGQGGMGAVYQAHDSNTDRAIALKVLLPSLFKNERAKARFLSEAKISQQLSHPHIVNVYDVQQDGELFFLTMELLEGQDLRGWLDNLKAVGQQPAIDEVKRITGELCEALAYAHEYTIHRDIKPENIWLDEKGRVKLMDFGIAQVQSASQRTQTGAAMGTAYYMAPEQLQGRELKAQADIYAVGVLLYEMLTGQIPTGRFESALKLRPSVGKKLSAVIDQCLEVNPEKRFVSAKALKEALLEGKGIRASRASSADSGSGKNYGLAAGIVLAVMVLGGLGFSGQLNGVLEALKPLDRDLLAQQQADATRLLGEIRNLDSRLDNSLQDLERDVSEAQRNSAANLGHLEEWEQLARRHISESSELTRLEGELALGETLLRDESRSLEALTSLQVVREGYQGLLDKFNAIDRLLTEEARTASALEQWQSYRRGYEFADPPALSNIDAIGNDAARQKREGLIEESLKSQEGIQASYLLAREQVAGDIAQIDGERLARQAAEVAERERREELERQRVAADVAERERSAEAERQRLVAEAEAERQRLAELEQKLQPLISKYNLVAIPAGSFQMGSNLNEEEMPVHQVTVPDFLMMEHEMTFALWDECEPCEQADDRGWGRGNRPVLNVSWDDVKVYINWLNEKTGGTFRLPSEAEWEYAARAGSTTRYSWGDAISCSQAAYGGSDCDKDRTVSVKSYAANDFGLYDMHGNVSEWVRDCFHENYNGAPDDGSVWQGGSRCAVFRGGSQGGPAVRSRSAARGVSHPGFGLDFVGFRLVHDTPR